MWDFFETVRHRHSVRRYQTDMPVEDDKIHAILETACAAPTAGDLQSYFIYVVKDRAVLDLLSDAANNQSFISEANLCLVFCADLQKASEEFGDRGKSLYALQDATIAAAYSQLAIVAAGMGSTWIGSFDEDKVKAAIPDIDGYRVVALISVGYPAEIPEQTPRRSLKEIVRFI